MRCWVEENGGKCAITDLQNLFKLVGIILCVYNSLNMCRNCLVRRICIMGVLKDGRPCVGIELTNINVGTTLKLQTRYNGLLELATLPDFTSDLH